MEIDEHLKYTLYVSCVLRIQANPSQLTVRTVPKGRRTNGL